MKEYENAKNALLLALQNVQNHKNTYFEEAVTYTNLANTCLQLKQETEAFEYFTKAITLFENHKIEDNHYQAAISALATYYYQNKEYQKAADYFKKVMSGIEKHQGKNEFDERMQENYYICQQVMAVKGMKSCEEYHEA